MSKIFLFDYPTLFFDCDENPNYFTYNDMIQFDFCKLCKIISTKNEDCCNFCRMYFNFQKTNKNPEFEPSLYYKPWMYNQDNYIFQRKFMNNLEFEKIDFNGKKILFLKNADLEYLKKLDF